MAYIQLRPQHIVVCLVLHPESLPALDLARVPSKPASPPTVLLVEKGCPKGPAESVWNGIAARIQGERPFMTAAQAVITATGLSPSDLRLVRSGPVLSVIDKIYTESDEQRGSIIAESLLHTVEGVAGHHGSGSRTGFGSPREMVVTSTSPHYVQEVVPDLFHKDDNGAAYEAIEWLVHPFLFQATSLKHFKLSCVFKASQWVTPLEIAVQHQELQHCTLIPDLPRIVASVYISPLFNKVLASLLLDHYSGASMLTKQALELFEVAIQDAWRVQTGDSDEPGAPPPQGCDELDLGAPYLSQLPARLLLEHIRYFLCHLAQVRPALASVGSMCRYLDHHVRLGLKFLEQSELETSRERATSAADRDPTHGGHHHRSRLHSQKSTVARQGTFFHRFTFRPFRLGALEETSSDTEEEDNVHHQRHRQLREAARHNQASPAQTPKDLYNKSMGRVLLAAATYTIFVDSVMQRCVSHTKAILRESRRVLTYGGSSLVQAAIKRVCLQWSLGEPPLEVVCPEGRPLCEGVRFAEELLRSVPQGSLHIKLISEAQMGLFVHQVDCVFVGADSILPDGSFVNKVGTYLLALAAYHARVSRGTVSHVPFFVVGTTPKIITQDALDQSSKAQCVDSLILNPPQHPEGLKLPPEHPLAPLVSGSLVSENGQDPCRTAPCRTFLPVRTTPPIAEDFYDDGTSTLGSKRRWLESATEDNPFKVATHRIDARAPLGVIIEEKDAEELTRIYPSFGFTLFDGTTSKDAPRTSTTSIVKPGTFSAANVYFETVPSYLVTAYITERGLLRPSEVAERSVEVNDMIDQFVAEKF